MVTPTLYHPLCFAYIVRLHCLSSSLLTASHFVISQSPRASFFDLFGPRIIKPPPWPSNHFKVAPTPHQYFLFCGPLHIPYHPSPTSMHLQVIGCAILAMPSHHPHHRSTSSSTSSSSTMSIPASLCALKHTYQNTRRFTFAQTSKSKVAPNHLGHNCITILGCPFNVNHKKIHIFNIFPRFFWSSNV